MIPNNPKGMLLLISSIETVLTMTILWLQQINAWFSDAASLLLTGAGVVIAYYTILKLREDYRGKKLDNIIKNLEIKDLKSKQNEEH